MPLSKDCFSLDILLVQKIEIPHFFFRDIFNSCQWVTQIGLEPHQKVFFQGRSNLAIGSAYSMTDAIVKIFASSFSCCFLDQSLQSYY